jgi:hypothetical protein
MVNISAGLLSDSVTSASMALCARFGRRAFARLHGSSARTCTGGAVGRRSRRITDNQGLVGII